MPWARTDSMSERLKFVATYLEYEVCFSDLCHDFGISRKTGYKWVRRYEIGGASALHERSRAPRDHPNAVDEDVVEAIVALRRKHPRWGPRKPSASSREPERFDPANGGSPERELGREWPPALFRASDRAECGAIVL